MNTLTKVFIIGVSLLVICTQVTVTLDCYTCSGCNEPYGKPDSDKTSTNDNYCWKWIGQVVGIQTTNRGAGGALTTGQCPGQNSCEEVSDPLGVGKVTRCCCSRDLCNTASAHIYNSMTILIAIVFLYMALGFQH